MDLEDFPRVSALMGEFARNKAALMNFENEGTIVSFQVSDGPIEEGKPLLSVSVSTAGWQTPPAMTEAIRQMIAARQADIIEELSGLGVTGLESRSHLPPTPRRRKKP